MSDTPSDTPLPAYVDARKVFQQEAEISGFVALDRLPRFREGLLSDEGSVQVGLGFQRSDSAQQIITGSLQAEVEVRCERCLKPLRIQLEDDIHLALVTTEAQAGTLEPELDPWISDSYKLDLAALVEEQLLLCLPIVSYHTLAECEQQAGYQTPMAVAEAGQAVSDENPFSVLKKLKEGDKNS